MENEFFQQRLRETCQEELRQKKYGGRLSVCRLVCFCFAVGIGAISRDYASGLGYVCAAAFFSLFLYFIQKHQAVRRRIVKLSCRRQVIEAALARMESTWRDLAETGETRARREMPLARDLDIFGAGSLYQYLCCAHTPFGRRRLAEWLAAVAPSGREIILRRQDAVRELAENKDFFLDFQTRSRCFFAEKQPDPQTLITSLERAAAPGKKQVFFGRLLPALTVFAALLALWNQISPQIPAALCLGQLFAAGLFYRRHTQSFDSLHDCNRALRGYAELLGQFEAQLFQSPLLRDLQERSAAASNALRRLHGVGERAALRYNFVFFVFTNAFLLWDFYCGRAFDGWKRAHGEQARVWLQSVGEIEALLSLSSLCHSKERRAFPTFAAAEPPTLRGERLYHPLLDEKTAVPNDIAIAAQTAIITGSNMSGKTTFLRTLGLNCVLAFAGAPICGAALHITPMRLFTSMRIEDDIRRGVSSFYAELLRMKEMIEFAQERRPMLCLIDEIFKGTNSADRIVGAEAAVRQLTLPYSILLVSTHDRELCSLAEPREHSVVNFHFSEYYQDNQIYFDYAIKDGPCRTTNAKFLLKMIGIS